MDLPYVSLRRSRPDAAGGRPRRFVSGRVAWLAALSLLVVLLGACAPAAEERVEVVTLTEAPDYYPNQTGARWEYLPNNASLAEAPLVQVVAGPSVLDGEVWIRWDLAGRGLEQSNYRQYRSDGVFLTRRLRPGSVIDFEPPLREFPGSASLRVGAQWGGESVATVTFPESDAPGSVAVFDIQYSYQVVDERTVTVAERTLEVMVVELTSRNYAEDGTIIEEISQQVWFAPYVGVVKTDNDFFLVDSNIFGAPEAP